MDPIRFPLLVPNLSRDETRRKGSWGTNEYAEQLQSGVRAVKRPGLQLAVPGTGTGQGLFNWNGQLAYIYNDDLHFFNGPYPVPGPITGIGQFVGGYYAMVDNPPLPAGSDPDLWSLTPPDSKRYQAFNVFEYLNAINGLYAPGFPEFQYALTGWVTGPLGASVKAAVKAWLFAQARSCPGATARDTPSLINFATWTADYFQASYPGGYSTLSNGDSTKIGLSILHDNVWGGSIAASEPTGYCADTTAFFFRDTATYGIAILQVTSAVIFVGASGTWTASGGTAGPNASGTYVSSGGNLVSMTIISPGDNYTGAPSFYFFSNFGFVSPSSGITTVLGPQTLNCSLAALQQNTPCRVYRLQ